MSQSTAEKQNEPVETVTIAPVKTSSSNASSEKPAEKSRKKIKKPSEKTDKSEKFEKKIVKKSSSKDSSSVQPESVNESTIAESTDDVSDSSVDKLIEEFISRQEENRQRVKDDINLVRAIKKAYKKRMREVSRQKPSRASRGGSAPRVPSGFASSKSSRISDELRDFLSSEERFGFLNNKDYFNAHSAKTDPFFIKENTFDEYPQIKKHLMEDKKIARTHVTQLVIAYIKKQKLEKKENRRNIQPDKALEKLTGNEKVRIETMRRRNDESLANPKKREKTLESNEKAKSKNEDPITGEITYFNLQVHLNRHFINEAEERRLVDAQAESIAIASVSV